MNLFLLAKYFLPKILDQSTAGSIVEFGSFRGGSAIFLASVCRSLGLNVKVYGLDTFEGMPPADKAIDAHNAGDFSGVDLNELRAYVESLGLSDRLEFVQGIFEATAPALLARIPPVLLAHIDCDIYPSVAYSWDVVKPHMANGGYVAFDDAHASGCLGATEVVEEMVIRRDGLNCEQIWPHFVFRVWPSSKHDGAQSGCVSAAEFEVRSLTEELASAKKQVASLEEQQAQNLSEIEKLGQRLGQLESSLAGLDRAHELLKQQVGMAQTSRWVRLGRLFGIGPNFEIPE
jgi:predicted O-methyltransferase YrrM